MTKQIIKIEVTTSNWKKINLSSLIGWIANIGGLEITRLEVKEVKK